MRSSAPRKRATTTRRKKSVRSHTHKHKHKRKGAKQRVSFTTKAGKRVSFAAKT